MLTGEDELRREVIMDIMCLLKVDFEKFAQKYGIDFREKFAGAFEKLGEMQADGIVQVCDDCIEITELGRLFLRNVAMLFDGRMGAEKSKYSKTI